MKLYSIVKGALQKFKKTDTESSNNGEDQGIPDDFHQTPAGGLPRNGTRGSVISVVMYYLAKIITIIGFIMVARAVWFEEVCLLYSLMI